MNKQLSKPAKVAATHALKELDYTFEEIAEILGIGLNSAKRYINEQSDQEWAEFGTNIKKLTLIKEEKVASQALDLIHKKMPEARFFELVGAYKVIRELQQPKSPSVAIQQNIGGEMGVRFVEDNRESM